MRGGHLDGGGTRGDGLAAGLVGEVGGGGAPEQVLVNGHAPSLGYRAPLTSKGPVRRRETAYRALRFARGGGCYFSFVPVERRFAHASVTRLAMLASASLPQVRGS
ncbi:hypothetical protein GCM10017778_59350 [Streptomyces vinaceus]|nr:hypothetical protein GCM10017778_59350 [Streptomyces vinaceus]